MKGKKCVALGASKHELFSTCIIALTDVWFFGFLGAFLCFLDFLVFFWY